MTDQVTGPLPDGSGFFVAAVEVGSRLTFRQYLRDEWKYLLGVGAAGAAVTIGILGLLFRLSGRA